INYMLPRIAEKWIKHLSRQFRALAIVGPRQSGKTTLVKKIFTRKAYVSLEDPDERMLAAGDPRAFLQRFKNGAVIDEAQRVPELFSYMQGIIDRAGKDNFFILTGSNNFLLQESISQSLAGRIGYADLLPLSYHEITQFGKKDYSIEELIINGCYPEVFDKNRNHTAWYPAYIRTYIERGVKQIRNIESTILFNRFLKLCAGRTGQQLNVAALSVEAGIDIKTVQAWLSILQSSYIIYLLHPYHRNFNKRVVKTPKLYFIDTGVACSLLGIRQAKELENSHYRGALFENYLVMELLKEKYNKGSVAGLYYWKENNGLEIDLLIETGKKIIPVEIKSTATFAESLIKNLQHWNRITGNTGGVLLYNGDSSYLRSDKIKVTDWKQHDLKF
ncbi:MAG TPA: ATP-binding protein, partial [Chitinophagaceae bacterium]|nr:ATP-binding protein [Chitinophagaceae bacterium]